MATCTGLSIMLVEACRSVAVPARLAGIASWPGRGGNHTWVEVWDNGWHFVGAAEPDDKGLDHAWFVGDASKAIKGTSRNAIYAVTYRSTGDFFPLVWAPAVKMPGEDVTDRYSRGKPQTPATSRLMVEVRRGGDRVEALVTTLDRQTGASRRIGSSLGPTADINRHLTCEAPAVGGPFFIVARHDGHAAILAAKVTGAGDTVVRIDLDRPVPDATRAELGQILTDRFGTAATKKAAAAKVLAQIPWVESLRELAWSAFKASPAHEPLASNSRRRPWQRKIARALTSGGMWVRSPRTAGPWSRHARRRQRTGLAQRSTVARNVSALQRPPRVRRLCLPLPPCPQRHLEWLL